VLDDSGSEDVEGFFDQISFEAITRSRAKKLAVQRKDSSPQIVQDSGLKSILRNKNSA
jgi:hypothetical protein